MTIIPPKDEKPSINGYRDYGPETKYTMSNEISRWPPSWGVESEKTTDLRIFTLNLP
jgi:hypothetical protein